MHLVSSSTRQRRGGDLQTYYMLTCATAERTRRTIYTRQMLLNWFTSAVLTTRSEFATKRLAQGMQVMQFGREVVVTSWLGNPRAVVNAQRTDTLRNKSPWDVNKRQQSKLVESNVDRNVSNSLSANDMNTGITQYVISVGAFFSYQFLNLVMSTCIWTCV